MGFKEVLKTGKWNKKLSDEEQADKYIEDSGKHYMKISNFLSVEILDILYDKGWEVVGISDNSHGSNKTLFKKNERGNVEC